MHKPNIQKLAIFLAIVSLSSGWLSAQQTEAPVEAEAEASYKKISVFLKSGDLQSAYALMTDEELDEQIGSAMLEVATALASKHPLPQKFKDGTKIDAKPADLGFDTWDPPAWMKKKKMGASPDEWDMLEEDLLKRFNALPDRKAALKNLDLLNRSLGAQSLFDESVVPPREGFEPRANRLWIVTEDDPDSPIPLLFEKQGGEWKFAGIDWDTDDEIAAMWKFEEKKEHPISGPGPHGEEVSLKGLEGQVVLIDFWGTW